MATIRRRGGLTGGGRYRAEYGSMPLEEVANSVRSIPKEWLSADELDVTEAFERYARPLIGEQWPAVELERGIQRFARLTPKIIDQRLSAYVPQRYRNGG